MYPEESKKVLVVADIIEKFNFKYVYAVTDDNVEGDAAIATLKEKLGKKLIVPMIDFMGVIPVQTLYTPLRQSLSKRILGLLEYYLSNTQMNSTWGCLFLGVDLL